MSSPNMGNGGPGMPEGLPDIIELFIPKDIDEDWCRQFQARYGGGFKRTLVPADFCLREAPGPNCAWDGGYSGRYFKSIDVPDATHDPEGIIDGRVLSAILIPDTESRGAADGDEDDGELNYEPYLILDEVESFGPAPLTLSPGQQIMVPLEPETSLLLFD